MSLERRRTCQDSSHLQECARTLTVCRRLRNSDNGKSLVKAWVRQGSAGLKQKVQKRRVFVSNGGNEELTNPSLVGFI